MTILRKSRGSAARKLSRTKQLMIGISAGAGHPIGWIARKFGVSVATVKDLKKRNQDLWDRS